MSLSAAASRWHGVVCCFAFFALLGSFGCDKARRRYPTISAASNDGGNANIHGDFNRCPLVVFVASPDHAQVGRPISLTASASDQDGDALTYVWAAPSGAFSSTNAAMTTFACDRNGVIPITLSVSDWACTSTSTASVICAPADGGADASGPGTGGQTGTGGTGGQPGTGGTGGLAIGTAGSSGTGGTAGTGIAGAGAGGAGMAGTTGAGGTTGTGGGGGTACFETNPPASIAAACTACVAQFAQPNEGCCNLATLDPTGFTLCQATSACMRAGGPPIGPCNVSGDTTTCYCGTKIATCETSGEANGPCLNQIKAAAGRNVLTHTTDAPTAAQILSRIGDTDYAVGRATMIQSFAGQICSIDCEVGM